MVEIDGSMGEGGGQVLRTSLALSMLTGEPLHLVNIRARRSKPGLQAQHLACVEAAAAVCRARVEGAALHASEIRFWPGTIRSGRYRFEVKTAGSACLVLQTILLPLSTASSASSVDITGGTHVPWSPSSHYLDWHWLPMLRWLGYDAELSLLQAGYYPRGGGRLQATIRPAGALRCLTLTEPGSQYNVRGLAGVSNLDQGIAERMKRHSIQRLIKHLPSVHVGLVSLSAASPGAFLVLRANLQSQPGSPPAGACFVSLGAPSLPAERVADSAVDQIVAFLDSGACLDAFMADQLLLPLVNIPGESRFTTNQLTPHVLTNAAVIREFLSVKIDISSRPGAPSLISVCRQE